MKVLMVCLGNICRSPLAEGILQHKANAAGLNWQVESAGIGNWHVGDAPHKLSQKVAKLNGIDICQQRGRQFKPSDMEEYDHVFFMDEENYQDGKFISGKLWDEEKADMMLNGLFPGENRSVPDPFYGGEQGFHDVFHLLSDACDAIIEKHAQASQPKNG